jgi:hypothetical protein
VGQNAFGFHSMRFDDRLQIMFHSFIFPSLLTSQPHEEPPSIDFTPLRADYLGNLSVMNYRCFIAGCCCFCLKFYLTFVFPTILTHDGTSFIVVNDC